MRKVREGKRGAARLEEALARGIRKARGLRVTPRKRRRRERAPVEPPPQPLCLVDSEPPGEAWEAFPPSVAPAHGGDRDGPGVAVGGTWPALPEGPGPPV